MLIETRITENGEVILYDREAVAIERLKIFEAIALSLSEDGYYLADSGGKDSVVIKKLAELAGVKFEIVHNHTTVDHPSTVYFVRSEKKRYESLGIKYTISMPEYNGKPTSMWKLIVDKGIAPTRIARYCCVVLKESGGVDRVVITGVRKAESFNRSTRGIAEVHYKTREDSLILHHNDNDHSRKEFETCQLKGKRIVNPIIDWSDSDV